MRKFTRGFSFKESSILGTSGAFPSPGGFVGRLRSCCMSENWWVCSEGKTEVVPKIWFSREFGGLCSQSWDNYLLFMANPGKSGFQTALSFIVDMVISLFYHQKYGRAKFRGPHQFAENRKHVLLGEK
jgi:hypothetical protein